MIYYIISILLFLVIIYFLFIYILKIKIKNIENQILSDFKDKTNHIPSLYESTKNNLNKHSEIFKEIIKLKNQDFLENTYNTDFLEKVHIQKLITSEIDFIFKLCEKHPELNKYASFLYVKEIIFNKKELIKHNLKLYKKIIQKYNLMILIKNLTIIGLLIPINKKGIK